MYGRIDHLHIARVEEFKANAYDKVMKLNATGEEEDLKQATRILYGLVDWDYQLYIYTTNRAIRDLANLNPN